MKKKNITKKESQLDTIARNVALLVADSGIMKKDIQNIRENMATKEDIHNLEQKLIEDTGSMTSVEQKHYHSHAQRIARLEKAVFPA